MKKVKFAYNSAVIIIVLLVSLSQIAIQITLAQEFSTRSIATIMNRQELRTQRMLRSSLLLLAPNPMDKAINPLQADPAKQLNDDLTFTRQTQSALSSSDTSIDATIAGLGGEYQAMHETGIQMLIDYKKKDRKSLGKHLAPFFEHEQKYLTGIYQAYIAQTAQADDLVNRVQILEISIYVITLIVIAYEVFGVVIPTVREQQVDIVALRERVAKLQDAMNVTGASEKKEGGEIG